MTADIQNYFLDTPMARPDFIKVHYTHIPEDIRVQSIQTTRQTIILGLHLHPY